jgi:hypothetical protein
MGSDGMDERGVVSPGHASSMLLLFLLLFFSGFDSHRLFENGLDRVRKCDMTWHGIAFALHIADRESSGTISLFFTLHVKRFLHRLIVFEWIPITANCRCRMFIDWFNRLVGRLSKDLPFLMTHLARVVHLFSSPTWGKQCFASNVNVPLDQRCNLQAHSHRIFFWSSHPSLTHELIVIRLSVKNGCTDIGLGLGLVRSQKALQVIRETKQTLCLLWG